MEFFFLFKILIYWLFVIEEKNWNYSEGEIQSAYLNYMNDVWFLGWNEKERKNKPTIFGFSSVLYILFPVCFDINNATLSGNACRCARQYRINLCLWKTSIVLSHSTLSHLTMIAHILLGTRLHRTEMNSFFPCSKWMEFYEMYVYCSALEQWGGSWKISIQNEKKYRFHCARIRNCCVTFKAQGKKTKQQ